MRSRAQKCISDDKNLPQQVAVQLSAFAGLAFVETAVSPQVSRVVEEGWGASYVLL